MTHHTNGQNLQECFDRDGYVFFRGFVDSCEIAEIKSELASFFERALPKLPAHHVYFEKAELASTLKQIQQLGEHSAYFRDWQQASPFRLVAEQLLGGPVVPKNMQYFNKPPLVGQATPPHQDGYYFMLDPCEAVTMWLALEAVDETTGCVRYVPGSHTQGMRPHAKSDTLGFSQGITDFPTEDDSRNEVACPAEPGDLLIHHALTIHRAERNRSQIRSRQALGFIYYSEQAREDTAAHQAYQRKLTEELTQARLI